MFVSFRPFAIETEKASIASPIPRRILLKKKTNDHVIEEILINYLFNYNKEDKCYTVTLEEEMVYSNENLVEFLRSIVKTPSLSGQENLVVDVISKKMKETGKIPYGPHAGEELNN